MPPALSPVAQEVGRPEVVAQLRLSAKVSFFGASHRNHSGGKREVNIAVSKSTGRKNNVATTAVTKLWSVSGIRTWERRADVTHAQRRRLVQCGFNAKGERLRWWAPTAEIEQD